MATAHHGDGHSQSELEALREQNRLHKKLFDQMNGERGKREYPQGRVGPDDDGELAYMIGADEKHGIVRIEFGKPVEWIGLPPQHAIDLAQALIKHARSISKEPLRIAIN